MIRSGKSPNSDATTEVTIYTMFGHIVTETRMRPEGDRIIGEGRCWHYDADGLLFKDTGWQPTGSVAYWPKDEPRPWWKFWA